MDEPNYSDLSSDDAVATIMAIAAIVSETKESLNNIAPDSPNMGYYLKVQEVAQSALAQMAQGISGGDLEAFNKASQSFDESVYGVKKFDNILLSARDAISQEVRESFDNAHTHHNPTTAVQPEALTAKKEPLKSAPVTAAPQSFLERVTNTVHSIIR